MQMLSGPLSPEIWLRDVFSAKQVLTGGIIRRKTRDIERYVGREAFESEVRRRGFQAVENAGHIIVFCNQERIRCIV
ncbi:N-(5'-phosphoribosyl)anthranilate isomerase [Sulfitobacter alexandrii]|uniref:N-(5'-phosphoribosyl)anthranilate isomerase n=1 Tax=Sulfitobacter alexandrii TaxID=1917485 RepID=A0A1J0WG47_9RHOB|nr:N-(5'-phosphoribosyl)anthranilate isomerase [Sulfitobacter alexandrii]APE43289.1 N-(5'-phosphoribosyl)anthranilate isomerase [Sulfitobacter alexandrii]